MTDTQSIKETYICTYIYILHTCRECPDGAYPMKKVEVFIDRLGWDKIITMMDLILLDPLW